MIFHYCPSGSIQSWTKILQLFNTDSISYRNICLLVLNLSPSVNWSKDVFHVTMGAGWLREDQILLQEYRTQACITLTHAIYLYLQDQLGLSWFPTGDRMLLCIFSLWLCWSDKTQFMMDHSVCMVICFKYWQIC